MLKTTRKYRPPITQLREAAGVARRMLVEKKIQHEKSIFDSLKNDPDAPVLPGIYPYIPHKDLIREACVSLIDLTKRWLLNNADNEDYQQNVIPFFRFVLKELEKEETKWFMRMKKSQLDTNEEEMRPLSDIFSVQRKYNSVVALKYFIMDSFAVSEIVKSNNGVSSYIEWFIDDWTPKLNNLWSKNKNGQKK